MVEEMLAGCVVLTTGSGGVIEVAELADLPRIPKANLVAFSMLLTELVTNPSELDESPCAGKQSHKKNLASP